MSESNKSAAQPSQQGVFLTGEFVAVSPGKAWTDRESNEHQPYRVRLLVGESVLTVEYDDEASAGAAVQGKMKGDTVTCRVFVQGPFDSETRRRGPVFFRGR